MDKQLDVGYGVLDMRVGEQLPQAWHQIHQTFKDQPTVKLWYFDLIHTPNQAIKAIEWAQLIRDMIVEETNAPTDKIFVETNQGFHNVNKQILKARNILFKSAHEHKVASVDQKVIK